MKIRVETDGNSIYLADEHGTELPLITNEVFWRDDYSSPLEWMQAVISDLDAPEQAKTEALDHAGELLEAWDRVSKMLSQEAKAARLEQLEADMYVGGGYGEDAANAHAWDEIDRLKRELNDAE